MFCPAFPAQGPSQPMTTGPQTGVNRTPTDLAEGAANKSDSIDYGPSDPWRTCLVPMMVFLAVGLLEPTKEGGGVAASLGISYELYPFLYAIRVAVTLGLLAWIWPSLRGWLGRPTWWPPLVGLLMVVPWVWLSHLQRDGQWLSGDTGRIGFDPFELYGAGSASSWAYLALRGLGLVIVVPIVEELFLRGFLMRFVVREHFWQVPFGAVSGAALATCGLYAVGSHPAEAVAAIAWFAVMTWIAAATRKPIDCILAHAATNLALGAWVIYSGDWWLR
jgi:CAAX prenyl protease-like protein